MPTIYQAYIDKRSWTHWSCNIIDKMVCYISLLLIIYDIGRLAGVVLLNWNETKPALFRDLLFRDVWLFFWKKNNQNKYNKTNLNKSHNNHKKLKNKTK